MKDKLTTAIFFNHCFDKRRFQNFIYWFLKKSHSGQSRLLKFLEKLKFLGFHSATQAGFSMSIDDLKIPSSKSEILLTAENIVLNADIQLISGNLTIIERYQRIIEIWNRTSEELKYQVLQSFKISDFLNPVYLMAFSGARGNISQIRQLVGMRGLMADPQGQIIDFPIRSNFREGLTLTEYLISCSGARKGIVDTALRTAASGYLTRRLVDVAHHVIVNQIDCQRSLVTFEPQAQFVGIEDGNKIVRPNFVGGIHSISKKSSIQSVDPNSQFGIWIDDLYDQQKKILSLQQRLVGRVLAETILASRSDVTANSFDKGCVLIIGQKNHEISKITSQKICKYRKKVLIRSPLTCQSSKFICQLCYGWNLAEGQLVSVGEAVGVLAAQSIGEPGTQMTMRTFHTGGVFTGILMDQTYAPFSGIVHYNFPCQGLLIRTLQGKIAYLSKNNGILSIFKRGPALAGRHPRVTRDLGRSIGPSSRALGIAKRCRSGEPSPRKTSRLGLPHTRSSAKIRGSQSGRRASPVSSSSFYFILKKLRGKYHSSYQNFNEYCLKLQKNKEVLSNSRNQPLVEDDEMHQQGRLAPPQWAGTKRSTDRRDHRPLLAQGSLLRQLTQFNFQLKGMIFFNPIDGQEPHASIVGGWPQRSAYTASQAQLIFLQKRIKKKNKIRNIHSLQIINKIYRQTGLAECPKNIVWKIDHLKSKYRTGLGPCFPLGERSSGAKSKGPSTEPKTGLADPRTIQAPFLNTQLKSPKQIQFIFQNFSILYVRQNENVLKKQLIAELPFFENETSLENEQEILSNESGEIYFEDLQYLEKTISDIKNEIQFKKSFVRDLGGFWILFGRSFQHSLMIGEANAIFLKKLDLIDPNVPFSQIQIQSHNVLNNEIDDLFCKNNFLQLEQIFLSSFLREINTTSLRDARDKQRIPPTRKPSAKYAYPRLWGRAFRPEGRFDRQAQGEALQGAVSDGPSTPLLGPSGVSWRRAFQPLREDSLQARRNEEEYTLILKRYSQIFQMNLIFFKKLGYLQIPKSCQRILPSAAICMRHTFLDAGSPLAFSEKNQPWLPVGKPSGKRQRGALALGLAFSPRRSARIGMTKKDNPKRKKSKDSVSTDPNKNLNFIQIVNGIEPILLQRLVPLTSPQRGEASTRAQAQFGKKYIDKNRILWTSRSDAMKNEERGFETWMIGLQGQSKYINEYSDFRNQFIKISIRHFQMNFLKQNLFCFKFKELGVPQYIQRPKSQFIFNNTFSSLNFHKQKRNFFLSDTCRIWQKSKKIFCEFPNPNFIKKYKKIYRQYYVYPNYDQVILKNKNRLNRTFLPKSKNLFLNINAEATCILCVNRQGIFQSFGQKVLKNPAATPVQAFRPSAKCKRFQALGSPAASLQPGGPLGSQPRGRAPSAEGRKLVGLRPRGSAAVWLGFLAQNEKIRERDTFQAAASEKEFKKLPLISFKSSIWIPGKLALAGNQSAASPKSEGAEGLRLYASDASPVIRRLWLPFPFGESAEGPSFWIGTQISGYTTLMKQIYKMKKQNPNISKIRQKRKSAAFLGFPLPLRPDGPALKYTIESQGQVLIKKACATRWAPQRNNHRVCFANPAKPSSSLRDPKGEELNAGEASSSSVYWGACQALNLGASASSPVERSSGGKAPRWPWPPLGLGGRSADPDCPKMLKGIQFYKKFYLDAIKIQFIFCNLFLKQSRLFQNLPQNWARQIMNIQPKIIHWKNLPNQKCVFLLNFITHFHSAKFIEQKNLKTINNLCKTQKTWNQARAKGKPKTGLQWHPNEEISRQTAKYGENGGDRSAENLGPGLNAGLRPRGLSPTQRGPGACFAPEGRSQWGPPALPPDGGPASRSAYIHFINKYYQSRFHSKETSTQFLEKNIKIQSQKLAFQQTPEILMASPASPFDNFDHNLQWRIGTLTSNLDAFLPLCPEGTKQGLSARKAGGFAVRSKVTNDPIKNLLNIGLTTQIVTCNSNRTILRGNNQRIFQIKQYNFWKIQQRQKIIGYPKMKIGFYSFIRIFFAMDLWPPLEDRKWMNVLPLDQGLLGLPFDVGIFQIYRRPPGKEGTLGEFLKGRTNAPSRVKGQKTARCRPSRAACRLRGKRKALAACVAGQAQRWASRSDAGSWALWASSMGGKQEPSPNNGSSGRNEADNVGQAIDQQKCQDISSFETIPFIKGQTRGLFPTLTIFPKLLITCAPQVIRDFDKRAFSFPRKGSKPSLPLALTSRSAWPASATTINFNRALTPVFGNEGRRQKYKYVWQLKTCQFNKHFFKTLIAQNWACRWDYTCFKFRQRIPQTFSVDGQKLILMKCVVNNKKKLARVFSYFFIHKFAQIHFFLVPKHTNKKILSRIPSLGPSRDQRILNIPKSKRKPLMEVKEPEETKLLNLTKLPGKGWHREAIRQGQSHYSKIYIKCDTEETRTRQAFPPSGLPLRTGLAADRPTLPRRQKQGKIQTVCISKFSDFVEIYRQSHQQIFYQKFKKNFQNIHLNLNDVGIVQRTNLLELGPLAPDALAARLGPSDGRLLEDSCIPWTFFGDWTIILEKRPFRVPTYFKLFSLIENNLNKCAVLKNKGPSLRRSLFESSPNRTVQANLKNPVASSVCTMYPSINKNLRGYLNLSTIPNSTTHENQGFAEGDAPNETYRQQGLGISRNIPTVGALGSSNRPGKYTETDISLTEKYFFEKILPRSLIRSELGFLKTPKSSFYNQMDSLKLQKGILDNYFDSYLLIVQNFTLLKNFGKRYFQSLPKKPLMNLAKTINSDKIEIELISEYIKQIIVQKNKLQEDIIRKYTDELGPPAPAGIAKRCRVSLDRKNLNTNDNLFLSPLGQLTTEFNLEPPSLALHQARRDEEKPDGVTAAPWPSLSKNPPNIQDIFEFPNNLYNFYIEYISKKSSRFKLGLATRFHQMKNLHKINMKTWLNSLQNLKTYSSRYLKSQIISRSTSSEAGGESDTDRGSAAMKKPWGFPFGTFSQGFGGPGSRRALVGFQTPSLRYPKYLSVEGQAEFRVVMALLKDQGSPPIGGPSPFNPKGFQGAELGGARAPGKGTGVDNRPTRPLSLAKDLWTDGRWSSPKTENDINPKKQYCFVFKFNHKNFDNFYSIDLKIQSFSSQQNRKFFRIPRLGFELAWKSTVRLTADRASSKYTENRARRGEGEGAPRGLAGRSSNKVTALAFSPELYPRSFPRFGLNNNKGEGQQRPIPTTTFNFKTYKIFQNLLSIYLNSPKPFVGHFESRHDERTVSRRQRRIATLDYTPFQENILEFKLLKKQNQLRSSHWVCRSNAANDISQLNNLLNFISLTLQTEYWNNFSLPNPSKYPIPLLDRNFEIFLVSIVPIRAPQLGWRLRQRAVLKPEGVNQKCQGLGPKTTSNRSRTASNKVDGRTLPPKNFYFLQKSYSATFGNNLKIIHNQTHSLKIHITRTKRLNFLTQKYLTNYSKYLYLTRSRGTLPGDGEPANRLGEAIASLKNTNLWEVLPLDQNLEGNTKRWAPLTSPQRGEASARAQAPNQPCYLQRDKNQTNNMNFQIIKKCFPNSSEIQVFIRFFLPVHSGEIMDPLFHKQGSQILFANVSDFFSCRHIVHYNQSNILNYKSRIIVEQKLKYFLENKFFGKIQKLNARTAMPKGIQLLKKPKESIFYKLQNKNQWSKADAQPEHLVSERLAQAQYQCIKFPRKNKVYKYKSNLDGRPPAGVQLFAKGEGSQRRPSWGGAGLAARLNEIYRPIRNVSRRAFGRLALVPRRGTRAQQSWAYPRPFKKQFCISQKIFYFYKFSKSFHFQTLSTTIGGNKNSSSPVLYFTQRSGLGPSAGMGKHSGTLVFRPMSMSRRRSVQVGSAASKLPPATLALPLRGRAEQQKSVYFAERSGQALVHPPNETLEQPSGKTRAKRIILGSFIRGGLLKSKTQLNSQGGQIIAKKKHLLLFRKATTHLLNDQSILHIQHGDMILKNQPLCSVFYNQSKTGDIVQGIPKIEEIFEARKKSKYSLHELPIFSKDFLFFEKIIIKYLRSLQKSVVNNIQRIYCGQGIHISDKHIEIIVRQMTSNVLILEPGQTGLLYGEIVALQWISRINTISHQVIYEPVLIGMTKTCLETSSFLSAASFQETTRILGRAALQNQIDFIRGLKQNVILGNLIPIGTGCF